MKRALLVVAAILVLAGIGLAVLVRQVFTGANVHAAIESQVSAALGQPVTIGSIGASVYPRVTLDLTKVSIGKPARIELATVHVGTGLRALISRRVEGADVRVDGARLTLPLPTLGAGGPSTPSTSESKPPVEIVSIDEIVLHGVEVVSGNRTLRGDIELVPHGDGAQIRRLDLAADNTSIHATGDLTSVAPMTGRLNLEAASLDIDRLVAFVNDFTAASMAPATGPAPAAGGGASSTASPVGKLTVGMKVGKATTGQLVLSDFSATAVVTPEAVQFEPLALGVFGGRYDGSMQLALGAVPSFEWRARVNGMDAASVMAFAGSPNTITGKLAGTVALHGEGFQMEQALRTARGRARIDITDGTIAGLQLVRTLVTAGSGRGGIVSSAGAAMNAPATPGGERFTRFGATLRLAGGVIETDDVAMASTDVDLSAAGSLRLAGMSTDLAGKAQLSEALSRQAGTDLYRYTQEGGRITLPVTVSGPLERLSVRVDVGDVALRAMRNKAIEEAQKAIEKKLPGFGDLFKRKPR